MLNFLKKDLKEEAKIARRRQNEEERKKRIFNPRVRLFGIDIEGLEQQLSEKREQQVKEQIENESYTQRKLYEDKICIELDRKIEKERKELDLKTQEFRQLYQQTRDRREFDLNDPDYIKKAICAENGVTIFEGEDLTQKDRLQEQKLQTKAWLMQQMHEKKNINDHKLCMDSKFIKQQLDHDRRACQLAQLEENCRRKLEEATAEYNKLVAEEKTMLKRQERDEEEKTNTQEIVNWVTGDFLNENPDQARNAFSPNRVIAFKYKGEPPEKAYETRKYQLAQIMQKQEREDRKIMETKKWLEYQRNIDANASHRMCDMLQQQRNLDNRLVEINSNLACQQRRREAINNDISELRPTPAFYDQFNRSTY